MSAAPQSVIRLPSPLRARSYFNERAKAVVLLTCVFWLGTFAILSLRGALIEDLPFAAIAPRRALISLFGALICIAMSVVIGQYQFRSFQHRILCGLAAAIVTAILMTAFHQLSYRYFDPLPGARAVTALEIAWWISVWLGYALAWTGTYFALLYHWQVQEQERRLSDMRALAQEAQLAALRSQISPHFLFNTLNGISASVLERDIAGAERMLENLATFFRASLSNHTSDLVELRKEIELQRLYLDIESVRFSERMRASINIPGELETALVPALILQPLVENAIKHGVGHSDDMTHISIDAQTDDHQLQLSVQNNAPVNSLAQGSGIGLKNVAGRLQAHFSDAAQLTAGPTSDGGYRAEIVMPLILVP